MGRAHGPLYGYGAGMRRSAAALLGLLLLGAAAAPLGVRANGIGHFDEVWVAHSGTAYGASGSSCRHPHFVADGSDDQDEISWALEDTNPNGTVHLCPGIYRFGDNIDLHSNDDVTIDGAGMGRTILDGGANYRRDVRLSSTSDIIYTYGSGELTLSNLTVQNAGGGYGALYLDGPLVVDHVRFYHNASSYEGGAIWGGEVTVIASQFVANAAGDGDAGGGAISASDLHVVDSAFTGNRGDGRGGAILASTIDVTGSTFSLNHALGGGAIAADDGVITTSTFKGNRSEGRGGAVYVEGSLNVATTDFRRNRSVGASSGGTSCDGGGGAVFAYDAAVTSSDFVGNSADAGSCADLDLEFWSHGAGVGGGLFVEHTSSVMDARFSSNRAAFLGGGAAVFGEPNFDGLAFVRNVSGG